MKLIDDATHKRKVWFSEQERETIFTAMELLWQWIRSLRYPAGSILHGQEERLRGR